MSFEDCITRMTQMMRASCALLALTILTGCGPSTDTTPSTGGPSAGNGGGFKVALVLPGLRADNGWNAIAYRGVQAVQKELNLKDEDVAVVDNQTSAGDQEKDLRAFAGKKYNIVIGHGNEFDAIANKIEGEFPKTLFVVTSGEHKGNNTTPIVLQLEDGAYLEGMLAAGMSKTGKIAEVGADAIPPVKSVFAAFEKGAKAVNPNIVILPAVYTNSWDDPGKAKAAANSLIDRDADVIMQDVDAAAQGVFNAVQDKNKAGKTVFALGTNEDQNSAAPDVILASAPIDLEKAFVPIAKQAQAGTFKPSTTPWDMKSGVIGFVYNPQLESKIPAALKAKIADAQKRIIDGTLKTK